MSSCWTLTCFYFQAWVTTSSTLARLGTTAQRQMSQFCVHRARCAQQWLLQTSLIATLAPRATTAQMTQSTSWASPVMRHSSARRARPYHLTVAQVSSARLWQGMAWIALPVTTAQMRQVPTHTYVSTQHIAHRIATWHWTAHWAIWQSITLDFESAAVCLAESALVARMGTTRNVWIVARVRQASTARKARPTLINTHARRATIAQPKSLLRDLVQRGLTGNTWKRNWRSTALSAPQTPTPTSLDRARANRAVARPKLSPVLPPVNALGSSVHSRHRTEHVGVSRATCSTTKQTAGSRTRTATRTVSQSSGGAARNTRSAWRAPASVSIHRATAALPSVAALMERSTRQEGISCFLNILYDSFIWFNDFLLNI